MYNDTTVIESEPSCRNDSVVLVGRCVVCGEEGLSIFKYVGIRNIH